MNTKLEIAKKLLRGKIEDLENRKENLMNVEDNYIGEMLEVKIRDYTKWLEEDKIEVEAMENYIKNIEDFLKQDLDIETTETKVASELLNNEPQ